MGYYATSKSFWTQLHVSVNEFYMKHGNSAQWPIVLQLFAMAVSHKLAGIPTEQSIQEENEDRTRKREKLKNFLNGMLQETRSKSKTKSLDGFNTRSNGSHASYDAPIRKTRSVGRTRSKRRSQR